MEKLKNAWEAAENLIIRPPRCRYTLAHLGPQRFAIKGHRFERKDVEVKNERGLILQVSIFQPDGTDSKPLPCVIYCHGNCGSRVDGLRTAELMLPNGFRTVAFDFAGCGKSEGDTISLGYYERYDIQAVVEYLRSNNISTTIALWGRSMGASSSLMYSHIDPSIAGMVLDSPFTGLVDLMPEVVANSKIKIPGFMVKLGAKALAKGIKKRAHFDIHDVSPIEFAANAYIPALFAHGKDDDFVLPHHSRQLFEVYGGDKEFIEVEGDHNQDRPDFFHEKVAGFLTDCLLNTGGSGPPPDTTTQEFLNTIDIPVARAVGVRPLSTSVRDIEYDASPSAAVPGIKDDLSGREAAAVRDASYDERHAMVRQGLISLEYLEMSEEEMLQRALLASTMEASPPPKNTSRNQSAKKDKPAGPSGTGRSVEPCEGPDEDDGDVDGLSDDEDLRMAIRLSLQEKRARYQSTQSPGAPRPKQSWPTTPQRHSREVSRDGSMSGGAPAAASRNGSMSGGVPPAAAAAVNGTAAAASVPAPAEPSVSPLPVEVSREAENRIRTMSQNKPRNAPPTEFI